jgi:hypothetical protein
MKISKIKILRNHEAKYHQILHNYSKVVKNLIQNQTMKKFKF